MVVQNEKLFDVKSIQKCIWSAAGKTGGLGGVANTPQAIAKRYSTGGVALKLENVDKFWGIKHEIAK